MQLDARPGDGARASRRRGRRGLAALAAALAAALLAAGCGTDGAGAPAEGRVARVVDGDTIVLASGHRVRLVQIDAPELRGNECYARQATRALERLLPLGTRVRLETDPRLDATDRFGRLLRYVRANGTNVNVALVREGAAEVWFYDGVRGRYATELLAAQTEARLLGRGLWAVCPR